jgi:protein SCO1/2
MTIARAWISQFLLFVFLAFPALADDSAAHAYAAHGVIQKIAPDARTVTIHHQTIPGYMMEMTMDFPVHDPHQLDGLAAGDKVDFTLYVTATDSWVGNIHRTGAAAVDAAASPATGAKLKPGDLLPDPPLISETGGTVHLSDYRGKAVVFTFFFTRCPLPNYCPLMNRDFAQTRALLLARPDSPKNWQFLSISFDPDNDKPATLASYALAYRGSDARGWLFSAAPPASLRQLAPPLGLILMRAGNSISHNLRTVVVDPQGRLFRQFNDNAWTAEQLANTITQAAKLGR